MPKCTEDRIEFGKLGRRLIEADFSGGDLSSEGGMMLLRQVDQRIGLTRAAAAVLSDPRDPERIVHPMRDLLAQRIYALCCGHEDLNDHERLREDVLVQTALGRDQALASAPTLCRLETRATRAQCAALHEVLLGQFIAAHGTAPTGLVLDIDASDIPLTLPTILHLFLIHPHRRTIKDENDVLKGSFCCSTAESICYRLLDITISSQG